MGNCILPLLVWILLCLPKLGHTQNYPNKEDTVHLRLLKSLSEEADKESRMRIHEKLGIHFRMLDLSQARLHFQHAIDLANELKLERDLFYYYDRLSSIENKAGNYQKVLKILEEQLPAARAKGDSIIIHYHYNLGAAQQMLHAYEEASVHYNKVIQLSDSLEKPLLGINVLGLIAKLYTQQGLYKEALTQKKIALGKTLGTNRKDILAYIYKDMGAIYLHLNKLDSAEIFVHKALEISEKTYPYHTISAEAYIVLNAIFQEKKDFPQALEAANKALHLANKVQSEILKWESCQALAETHMRFEDYDKGLIYAFQAQVQAKALDNKAKLAKSYTTLQKLFEKKGLFEQAYKYQTLTYETELKFRNELKTLEKQKDSYLQRKKEQKNQEALEYQEDKLMKVTKVYGLTLLILILTLIVVLATFRKKPLFDRVSVNEDMNLFERKLKVLFIKKTSLMSSIIVSIILLYHFIWSEYQAMFLASLFLTLIGGLGFYANIHTLSTVFWVFAFAAYIMVCSIPLVIGTIYTGFLALITVYLSLNYLADKALEYIFNLSALFLAFIVYLYFLQGNDTPLGIETVGLEVLSGLGCSIAVVAIRYYSSTHSQYIRKELIKSHLFLEEIFDLNPFAIISLDRESKVTYANKITLEQLALTKEELIGKRIQDVKKSWENPNPWELDHKVLYEGITTFAPAFCITHKSGKDQYLDIIKKPIYDEHNHITGILMVGVDTTEKLTQQRLITQQVADLNEKNSELKKYIDSNNHLEQFAFLASHDLRTPIRTIVSFTQLLKRRTQGVLNEQEYEYMNFIIRASKNMMILVEDILSYSRVNSGKVKLSNVSISTLIQEVLEVLLVQIQEKKAEIQIGELPEYLVADASKMRQLFQNLLSNALKFSKPDVKPKLKISAEKLESEWRFCIQDNGIGIQKEYQKKIFLLFNRLHSDMEIEGFGIGLASCKKIVEQHEGKIWLRSELGKGSTFYFSIPFHLKTALCFDPETSLSVMQHE